MSVSTVTTVLLKTLREKSVSVIEHSKTDSCVPKVTGVVLETKELLCLLSLLPVIGLFLLSSIFFVFLV